MTTLAIVGAGPQVGGAVARRFGAEGFSIALLSRNQQRGDAHAAELAKDGLVAKAYRADVREPATVEHALDKATEELGPIEVLQYSPLPAKDYMRPVMETTVDDLRGPIAFSVFGAVAAVRKVVPGMRFLPGKNRGSILFVNGGTALTPREGFVGTSVAFAGLGAYLTVLNEVLGKEGIQVSQLIVGGSIAAGDKDKDPAKLAGILWDMHTKRDRFRQEVAT